MSVSHQAALEQLLVIIRSLPGVKLVTVLGPGGSQVFEFQANGSIGTQPADAGALRRAVRFALMGTGSLIIRQFLHLNVEIVRSTGEVIWVPQKRLYGCFLHEGKYFGLTSEQLRQTFAVDAQTGLALPPAPDELYADFPLSSE
ncbi:MAG: hypothetical protein CVV27_14615 [Candidatus Melainabacteria bacterium HGW-Melainabacteria-1]|nr:MAG: hypothetical protein CVV27_14615 [Candidatus Melainabacteria bacterium HGW-Melainabacteria-1]